MVKGNFITLPCDVICELGGDKLLQAWMVKASSLTDSLKTSSLSNGVHVAHSGGLSVWYDTKAVTPVKKEATDFVATAPLPATARVPPSGSIFPSLSKLVQAMPTDSLKDLMEEQGSLPIRHSLMQAHPRVRMLTTYRDAHIYIFPRWILDFIEQNERLDSISEDVVGWWAKAGWQKGLAEKMHIKSICDERQAEANNEANNESSSGSTSPSPLKTAQSDSEKWDKVTKMRHAGQETTQDQASNDFEAPSILAYLHSNRPEEVPLIRRVDTAQLLLAISLQLAKLPSVEEAGAHNASPFAHARKVAYPEGVKSRTTITKQDSLIAENVTVEEKTSIKETVVGAGCQINEGAKLSQCLLMEGVVVGKNCKLTKCILGKRCVIGDGSILTDCEVQENLLVEPKSECRAPISKRGTNTDYGL